MELISHWIDYKFRPNKTFSNHFEIIHQFHGIKLHRISESYVIKPKSILALQLFHEGVHFPNIDLHLKCKIENSKELVKVTFHVFDPEISKSIMKEIKNSLLSQLNIFQKKMDTDPTLNYVKLFCDGCIHENELPLNICIHTCKFEPKPDNH
ncbi:hypothetical protein BHF71_06745 [Vulcanibacillus modesticaldus]|uniref:Uncharacterized protein n=1 Tax=Vulcanibacillus modesticaldus TaxID=337097 RepID=A0A1D2YWI3_9BACI|nr:hypothetical protein [Vulcanibacillus modesticaldus]OEG00054.1 hypothetical protein BHF71_06745 [Vulcanibacillus modesticaldus]